MLIFTVSAKKQSGDVSVRAGMPPACGHSDMEAFDALKRHEPGPLSREAFLKTRMEYGEVAHKMGIVCKVVIQWGFMMVYLITCPRINKLYHALSSMTQSITVIVCTFYAWSGQTK